MCQPTARRGLFDQHHPCFLLLYLNVVLKDNNVLLGCIIIVCLFVFFLSIRNEPVEDRQFLKPQDLIKVLPLVSGFTLDIPPLSVWTLVNQLLLHVRFAVKSLHTRGAVTVPQPHFFGPVVSVRGISS